MLTKPDELVAKRPLMEKFNLEGGVLVERGEGAGRLIERRILIEDLQYMLLGYFFVIFILNLDLENI